LITGIIYGEQYRSLSCSLCSIPHSPATSSFLGLNSPSAPHSHTPSTFLPQCERPSFTPIQDNRINCSPMHLNFYIFE
jgi:hypothetical protein